MTNEIHPDLDDGLDRRLAEQLELEELELEEELAAQLAALPRELMPRRDLWPGIAARLAHGEEASELQTRRLAVAGPVAAPKPARWSNRALGRQALAALLWAALGASLTYLAMGGASGTAPGSDTAATGSRGSSPAAGAAGSAAVPVAARAADSPAGGEDYRLIEADYLRAKEALWVSVYARRDRFSPTTLAAVEKNFAIIDRAIFDLRRALDQDPGNRRLEEELYRNHRRGLDLLRRLADTT